ncbi:MAG: EAL domain-containing protein [Desulfobulbaceae bacterium]|nr:MAG: EAL domain-containing protein [Desulfobulbaceae bacterium]
MSLYRQLLIFTLTLCFVLFFGVWIDKLQSTRSFLSDQLESHAQDTATSLGLSLSPFISADDDAAIETMLNAIFDRGYYRTIVLRDVQGKTISERRLPIVIEHVPDWFVTSVPLKAPLAEALIMNGWNKAGSVSVESHPGYAYLTLWKTAVTITIYFLLTGVVVLVLGGVGLRILLRPLRRVEEQAEAICRKEYEIQEKLPRTRELRSVVVTMNKMTNKVKEMFEEQGNIAERLRQKAFGDDLTGLANRRYLTAQINVVLSGEDPLVKGAFMLIQIQNLAEINAQKGYAGGDELISKAAEIIKEHAEPWVGQVAARLGGGDFAVFLPDIDSEDSDKLAEQMATQLSLLSLENLSVSDNICSVGMIRYQAPHNLDQLLSEADSLLIAAREAGPNRWQTGDLVAEDKSLSPQGKVWWRKTLEKALANKALTLYGQQVFKRADTTSIEHLELFSRIALEDGSIVPAGIFIPLAERSALVTDLDRQIILKGIQYQSESQNQPIAINISATSVSDQTFVDWVLYKLRDLSPNSGPIYFEFAEFSAVQHLESIKHFAQQIKAAGHSIGLDHFGRSFSNFGYLKSLQPEYVKIDAAFTRELETENSDSYFFIGALAGVAHSLDIKVIAEGVEKDAQLQILGDLKVNGVQGYLLDRPTELTTV